MAQPVAGNQYPATGSRHPTRVYVRRGVPALPQPAARPGQPANSRQQARAAPNTGHDGAPREPDNAESREDTADARDTAGTQDVAGTGTKGETALKEKILVGHKLRRFRQSAGLSQTAMAEVLDISPSYLNLLEHNQRPLTVSLLLRLGNSFDIDIKNFAEDESPALMTELAEVFGDPLLAGERITRREIEDFVAAAPSAARGMLAMFHAYRKVRDRLEAASADGRHETGIDNPVEHVRDLLQQENNHFAELEQSAQSFRNEVLSQTSAEARRAGGESGGLLEALVRHAAKGGKKGQALKVRIIPAHIMDTQLRRFDAHRREILLSEALRRPQRLFHLLVQLALVNHTKIIDAQCERLGVDKGPARSLLRNTLAGYFAAAVMMPYDSFLSSARELRHDVDLLGRRFGASFEQVCHRLTSLNAPNAKGIPFFFIRVDDAGNISKRLAAGGMQFAKNGGTCPRWDLHKAFRTPGQMLFQAAELPNGQKFFTIARTVPQLWAPAGEPPPEFAVALGCEMHHARDLVYMDHLDAGRKPRHDKIGIGCAVCERMDCAQRAHAPVGHDVRFDGPTRRVGLYNLDN